MIESVLDRRLFGAALMVQYRVRWVGCGASYDSWEAAERVPEALCAVPLRAAAAAAVGAALHCMLDRTGSR